MSEKIIYEPHPVTPERKKELREKGYKIIDAQFDPNRKEEAPMNPVKASDAAIKHAQANGVNIEEVVGTGQNGAITKTDVDNHIAALSK
ncbi:E3 binding domain-containing protein [Dyadobacter jiangsuensis]|uniref:E3 binding domain-containing protein n=1 Tax=Dyadobacter jiangsuensis TaxID=1591085 RepID=A0A2P8FP17_9BACT|nr:E3 binding domain-containing protein [Dyadobacter jiangsuensis]PSL23471.1 e3 binding domain-containing protein [Dyadobacter jiangsuensis]